MWQWQARRSAEPDEPAKLAIGCLISALGLVWLAGAPWVSGADSRAPFIWAVTFHLISDIGFVYFVAPSTALYAASSPAALRGTLLGVHTLAVFFGSLIGGRLGGFYEAMSPPQFWLMYGAIVGVGGIFLFALAPVLRRLLRADKVGADN